MDKKSRLKMVTKLSAAGTEISDVALRYITQYLPQVRIISIVEHVGVRLVCLFV